MEKTKDRQLEGLMKENKLLRAKLLKIKKLIEAWKMKKNKH